jgi:ribose 5-phosphate isomerase RpiB
LLNPALRPLTCGTALSAAAMIPVIGGAAVAAKYANKASKVLDSNIICFSQKLVNQAKTDEYIV